MIILRKYLEKSTNLEFFLNNIFRTIIYIAPQGGQKRAKYGNELIKKWSIEFTKNYGKGYDSSNLKRFRQFFMLFPKGGPVGHLSWTHIVKLLPIKDENKRNYYINLCIEKNLSKRKLAEEIKSNSYERLVNKQENIELIMPKKEYSIFDDIKNPIIIEIDKNKKIKSEKDLENIIISEITFVLTQLGKGFCFIGNQYKIKSFFIDILLFNFELNCFVVVELKVRALKVEDKAQVEHYMKLIDDNLKKAHHNKTIGIIITKEQDKFIANFVQSDNLIPLTYKLEEKEK